jgi:hypothetical protein
MINQYDKVYIKKYHGNDLKPDKTNIYEIVGVLKTKNCMHNNTIFEKKALLSNGKEEIIYTYNIITKNREYYMEKVPWYKGVICCCYF